MVEYGLLKPRWDKHKIQNKKNIKNSNRRNNAMASKKIKISFYKKVTCWYAEVREHTESQNLMVRGADELCEAMAKGKKRVTIEMVISDEPCPVSGKIVALEKMKQGPYGADYRVCKDGFSIDGAEAFPETIWLCNVTKTVCGGSHPKYIYITEIEPNDGKPYDGKFKPLKFTSAMGE